MLFLSASAAESEARLTGGRPDHPAICRAMASFIFAQIVSCCFNRKRYGCVAFVGAGPAARPLRPSNAHQRPDASRATATICRIDASTKSGKMQVAFRK